MGVRRPSVRRSRWGFVGYGTLLTIPYALVLGWGARSFPRSPLFAFGINWLLVVWTVQLSQLRPLRLPAAYYDTRGFERDGRIYTWLGVHRYRRTLRPMLWSVKPALLRSTPGARETMMRSTYDPETGHLLIFVVIMGMTLWAAANAWWDTVAWMALFNVLHNLYPVASMRELRARLERRRDPACSLGGPRNRAG